MLYTPDGRATGQEVTQDFAGEKQNMCAGEEVLTLCLFTLPGTGARFPRIGYKG